MSVNSNANFISDSGPDVAGIAHDMRSPLSVIRTFLQLSKISDDNADMKALHAAAMRSVEKVLGLVEDLRRPVKKCASEFERCDIAKIVRTSLDEANALAFEGGINIRYVGPKYLSAVVDGKLIGRAITNLIVNAVQANKPGGEVRVALFVRNTAVYVEVVDNGSGINDAHLPKIFERGFTRGKADGTGIGLDLCRQIAAKHGGTIVVHSIKDTGTAFVLSLPHALDHLDDVNLPPPLATVIHAGFTFRKKSCGDIHPSIREDTLD